jgi:hypothetical protein
MRLMRDMVWLCASTAVAAQPTVETTVQAHATTLNSLPKHTYFDTDSYELYVDNCASRCITNDLADFVDPPVPADVKIYGTNGISSGTLMGTVEWPIEDDTGQVHKVRIPRTIYSENNRSKLLSPQHWSQEANDRYPVRNGTWCATLDDRIILFWDQQKYQKTVYLLPERTNVGIIRSAHGTQNYEKAYKAISKLAGTDGIVAMPTVLDTVVHHIDEYEEYEPTPADTDIPLVSDDENDVNEALEEVPQEIQPEIPQETQEESSINKDEQGSSYADLQGFNLDLDLHEEEETGASNFTSLEQEYIYWHTKLGHLSKTRIQQLAKRGAIPKKLAKVAPPICVACIHGKATKKPWRTKASPSKTPKVAMKPGECVAVDQMESSTAGFVGQLKGAILTTLRYKYATVFVDLFSDYTYVYLHTKITSEETVKAKKAFESHAESFGLTIKQYHADNGRFQDAAFKTHCELKGQTLTFCGVNAHFQNGRAERKIRDLQDGARTSLLHAIKKWPSAITINLWPYALRYANDVNNHVPAKEKIHSPIELFSSTEMKIPVRQFHHFGCPVYVLDSNLQANKRSGSKWKQQTRLGVNLGFSPQHAKSVHLVLSLTTGCVSPQFHCTFDNNFATIQEYRQPESLWQQKAHFVSTNQNTPSNALKARDERPQEAERISEEGITTPASENDIMGEIEPPLQLAEAENVENQTIGMREETPVHEGAGLRRSNRARRPPTHLQDYITDEQDMVQAVQASMAETMKGNTNQEYIAYEALHSPPQENPCDHDDPIAIAMKSIMDPDTLYLWEARKEPDFPKFLEAMQKEVDDHTREGHWRLVRKKDVPKGATILPAV